MASSATADAATRTPASPNENEQPANAPDVESIMAAIRRTTRERDEDTGTSEREFKSHLRRRMLKPLSSRGFSEDFIEGVRSREHDRWNISFESRDLGGGDSTLARVIRTLLSPFLRLALNTRPLAEFAARQAEINEYHRRLLWATNRDLEMARLELEAVKRELRKLGVNVDISFAVGPASAPGPGRGGSPSRSGPGRGRGDGRSGRGGSRRGSRSGRGGRSGDRRSSDRPSRSGGRER